MGRTAELGWAAQLPGVPEPSHSGMGGMWKKVNKTEDGVNKKT